MNNKDQYDLAITTVTLLINERMYEQAGGAVTIAYALDIISRDEAEGISTYIDIQRGMNN